MECDICGKECRNAAGLSAHMRSHKDEETPETAPDTQIESEAITEPPVASHGKLEPVKVAEKGNYSVWLSDIYEVRKGTSVLCLMETEEEAIRKMENFSRFN